MIKKDLYHRSGLSSSRPLDLGTPGGLEGFVRHIVDILFFRNEATYGLDTTRNQDTFCINNRHYEILRPIHVRPSLRGRYTFVYSLQGMYACGFGVQDVLFIIYTFTKDTAQGGPGISDAKLYQWCRVY